MNHLKIVRYSLFNRMVSGGPFNMILKNDSMINFEVLEQIVISKKRSIIIDSKKNENNKKIDGQQRIN